MYEIQDKWEKRATVRSRPRVIFDQTNEGYFYPLVEQPLAIHPRVMDLGEDALKYLLIQSLYKYSNDIATIETRVVNNTILNVVMDRLPINFTREQKLNLYTILVDEAYHAYVAYDARLQIEDYSGISPLPLPKTIEIEGAIVSIKSQLAEKYHGIFELICVCLAENTLTKEIVGMIGASQTHPFFQRMISDHLADESRHSGIFFHLLSYIWQNITDEYKENIANVLPAFLEQYLGVKVQIEFDKQILTHLGFSQEDSRLIIEDTYGEFRLTKESPKLKNILTQLNKSGLIDKFILPKLHEKNWI